MAKRIGSFVSGMTFTVVLVAGAVFASTALAATKSAGNGFGGQDEVILIAEIVLLLLIGRGLGEAMQRIGQPAVIGQLLAGLILGPSLFGWIWPQAHALIFPSAPEARSLLAGISDVGVLMLLLLTGMETDLKLVRKVGAPAIAITIVGVTVPFFCGVMLGQFIPQSLLPQPGHRLVASLFLGTALSISSIKIVAMVVHEMNFMRRNLGQIIVASAIMEDTTGWIIISITLGIAGAGGIGILPLAKTIIGTALFLVASYTLGRRLVFRLIRWVNDTFVSEYAVVTAILVVMCVLALVTQAIGVNTVLGAFVAGVLVGESPILSRHIQDQLRGLITAFMMPVFFGLSGLSTDLSILKDPQIALLTAALVAIASIGKFAGAFGGGMLGKLTMRESLALGCAMNARGSTEVIIASIGLTLGILTQNLYSMIVAMALVTTMTMPPMLRWALRQLPMKREERQRIETEQLDAKGFISRAERLLIAADKSADGEFATRLAGHIAGKRGIPVTLMQIGRKEKADTTLDEVAAESAELAQAQSPGGDADESADKVEVLARIEKKVGAAVAKEAPKGYDMLFVGLARMRDKTAGAFSQDVDRAAKGFEGPIVLAIADRKDPDRQLKLLVPVNGTEAARRGAELAFAMSAASDVTVLHVARRSERSEGRTKSVVEHTGEAVLEDMTKLAGRYGHQEIHTAVHMDLSPDDAILDEARRSGANVIVIGASRRIGDRLYLGQTVSSVMQRWPGAMVLVAS